MANFGNKIQRSKSYTEEQYRWILRIGYKFSKNKKTFSFSFNVFLRILYRILLIQLTVSHNGNSWIRTLYLSFRNWRHQVKATHTTSPTYLPPIFCHISLVNLYYMYFRHTNSPPPPLPLTPIWRSGETFGIYNLFTAKNTRLWKTGAGKRSPSNNIKIQ